MKTESKSISHRLRFENDVMDSELLRFVLRKLYFKTLLEENTALNSVAPPPLHLHFLGKRGKGAPLFVAFTVETGRSTLALLMLHITAKNAPEQDA